MKTKIYLKKTRLSLQLVPAVTILVALALSIPMSAQTVITFDAPGAGTGAFQGTYPFNVDPSGTIIGRTIDAGNVRHGFIRSRQGSYTIFDGLGQPVLAVQLNAANNHTVKVDHLKPGHYFISGTSSNGQVINEKIVVTQ